MERTDGLQAEFLRTVGKYRMISRGDKVLCALSGGADSVALAVLFSELAEELGVEIFAAHLNHCLRGSSSDRDERFVRDLCKARGIPLEVAREDIGEISKAGGTGIEETAREVRYRFLHEAAGRSVCTKIATAHNANDNAETILMNIARGAGLRGLCGIPPVRGIVIRPLLFSDRSAIEEYLGDMDISYVTDETNYDDSYTRNKIRHRVIPVMREINSSLTRSMGEMAELLRGDADFLDAAAEGIFRPGSIPPSAAVKDLRDAPDAISGRVIRAMYSAAAGKPEGSAGGLTKEHVDSVRRLVGSASPSGEVHLPDGIAARRSYGTLEMAVRFPETAPEEKRLGIGETRFGSWRIVTEMIEGDLKDGGNAVFLDPERIREGLCVRPCRTGDSISPAGRGWTKSLKKLYIEMKVPRSVRRSRPVITCAGAVCAIPGLAADRRFAASGPPAVKLVFISDPGE